MEQLLKFFVEKWPLKKESPSIDLVLSSLASKQKPNRILFVQTLSFEDHRAQFTILKNIKIGYFN